MGLKIKLVKSFSGASERQLGTITGLGLTKFGQERILKDTPAIRGMIFKVKHLVSSEVTKDEVTPRKRTKARVARVREAARAKAEAASRE